MVIKMIKRLKTRFILIATLCAFLVVMLFFAGVNILNYRQTMVRIDSELNRLLVSDKPSLPQDPGIRKPEDKPDGELFGFPRGIFGGELLRMNGLHAKCDTDGNIIFVYNDNVTSLTADDAAELVLSIVSSGRSNGRLGIYYYAVSRTNGDINVAVADAAMELKNCVNLLFVSALVSLLCTALSALLALLFSSRAIKPIMDNYLKQKQFITDAGHELKTPVAIIQANVEAFEITSGENKWTGNIKQQSERMIKLVKDMVFMARLDERASRLSMTLTPIDFSAVVAQTVDEFLSLTNKYDKTAETDITPNIAVTADEAELARLMSVLMDNAIKHSDACANIKVELIKDGARAKLSVSNPCLPIDKAKLKHLFDRFYRTDVSRSRETGGFGIGLSMAQAIVSGYGGVIKAKQSDGRLTITVWLPIMRGEPNPIWF